MSRWDALRPTNQEGRARRGAPSRHNGARRAASDGENVKDGLRHSPYTCVEPGASRIRQRECLARYEAFYNQVAHERRLTKSWHEVDKEAITSIARHIAENLDVLPAEQVARNSLLEVFLPVMMDDRSDEEVYRSLCSLICSMMRNPQFASALLAPTLTEICDDGGECLSVNPIRRRTFSALQKGLLSYRPEDTRRPTIETLEPFSKILWSCRTMSAMFEASTVVDGNNRLSLGTNDISATAISAFVSSVMVKHELSENVSMRELLNEALKLLELFLIRHPDSSTHFASLILSDGSTATRRTFDCCKVDSPSMLISLVHQGNSVARLCATELIRNLPLQSWLRRDNNAVLHRSTLSFPCRTESSLQSLVLITDCLLSRNRLDRDEGTLTLAVVLLERVPVDLSPSLIPVSLNLMNSLAHAMERTFETSNSPRALEMFLQLAGGHTTPEGATTAMCDSMRMWLNTGRGHSLVLRFLSYMKGMDLGRSGSVHRATRAILRSHPELVVKDPTLWSAFRSTYDTFFAGDDLVAASEGIALFESLLQGRHWAVVDRGDEFWRIQLEPLLLRLSGVLIGGNAAAKTVSTAALSQLLPQDWVEIGTQESARYLNIMATMIVDGNATARSSIFKALGTLLSNFYHPLRTASLSPCDAITEEALFQQLLRVTLDGCVDPSPIVRCMALFGLGNLCQSLCLGSATLALARGDAVHRMAVCACQHLSDKDVKVKGNAIRSAAHALCVVHRTARTEELGERQADVFLRAFTALVRQAQATLVLLHPERVAALTWKERQALKRLGWGSFNAMSRMFDDGIGRRNELSQSIEESLLVLVECVSRLPDLPEKVALAAGACLRSALKNGCTAATRETRSEERKDVGIGACAWSCISVLLAGRLEQNAAPGATMRPRSSQKMHSEAEMLLKVLLERCTTSDASHVLRQLERTEPTTSLRWLCDWMESHGSSPQAYASFAIALDSAVHSSAVDPELEALFAVRAMAISFEGGEVDEM